MAIFLLNESRDVSQLGSSSVFLSLEEVSSYVEPVDVDNAEYFLCDSTGQFYSISSTPSFDKFAFTKTLVDLELARKLFQEHLQSIGEIVGASEDLPWLEKQLRKRLELGKLC